VSHIFNGVVGYQTYHIGHFTGAFAVSVIVHHTEF